MELFKKIVTLIEELNSNNYDNVLNDVKNYLRDECKNIDKKDKDILTVFIKINILDKIDLIINEVPRKGLNDRRGKLNRLYLDNLNSFKQEIINLYFPLLKVYEEYSFTNSVTVLFEDLLNVIDNGFDSHYLFEEKFDLFKNKVSKHYSLVDDFRFISNTCLNFYESALKEKIKYQSQIDLNKDYIEIYYREFNNDLDAIITKDEINGEFKLRDFINSQNEIILELQISISQIEDMIDFFLKKDKFIGNQIVFKNPVLAYTGDELDSVFKDLSEYNENVETIYLLSRVQYDKLIKLESALISNGFLLKYGKKFKWINTKSKICELCYYLTENRSFNIDTKYSTFVKFFFKRYNIEITNQDLNKSKNTYHGKSIFKELLI
ncbi:hypothetical protein [Empedobacter sp. R132-2]|uniref:hypothetical protein n=1 Tax=Empedobacter sp. R132-2 TaxID=2746740 RepID=UPI0025750F9C|nr:hypothetical protein [Empedobacter sp. R132-2]MDM1138839.1 hypothetical protein [Empedobacter sp. R132-2]